MTLKGLHILSLVVLTMVLPAGGAFGTGNPEGFACGGQGGKEASSSPGPSD